MAKIKKTLQESHPEIAGMWVYELNEGLTPNDVSIYMDKEVYFQCKENPKHIFKKPISGMISRRDKHILRCPYCGPNAKVAFPGETDLLSVIHEARYMWDFENNTIDPKTVLSKSNKFAYFKCELGHSTFRKIQDFSKSPGCTECQKERTLLVNNIPQTKKFWDFTKNVCVDLNSLVQSTRDMVWFKCNKCDYEWNVSINLWRENSYCSCCGYDGHNYRTIEKDIITLKRKVPEIENFWDYGKNGYQTPNSVLRNSNYNAYFRCNLGHKFNSFIKDLFINDEFRGCSVCNPRPKKISPNKKLLFEQCLEAKDMWDYELNKELSTQSLTISSKKNAHFICLKGHKFETKISLFYEHPICKECYKIDNGNIVIKRSELLEYWDFDNNEIDPSLTFPNDKREVFWKCKRCEYQWRQKIVDRALEPK